MKTDIEFYTLFQACPHYVYELMGKQPPVGGCKMESVVLKALQQSADGVLTPSDAQEPLMVMEVQMGAARQVIQRTVIEVASLEMQHEPRAVIGVIFFQNEPPHHQWSNITCLPLVEAAKNLPEDHPLTRVLSPLLVADKAELANRVREDYLVFREAKDLSEQQKKAFHDVFFSWLLQRFSDLTLQDLEAMLEIKLTPLKETVGGRELIAEGRVVGLVEGRVEGRVEGKSGSILKFARRLGLVADAAMAEKIKQLDYLQLEQLEDRLLEMKSAAELQAWLLRGA